MSARLTQSLPVAQQALCSALALHYQARASHAAIIDRFGPVRPFAAAIQWEQRHIDSLRRLFAPHGWSAPDEAASAPPAPSDPATACIAAAQSTQEHLDLYQALQEMVKSDAEIGAVFSAICKDLREKHAPAFSDLREAQAVLREARPVPGGSGAARDLA